MIYQKEFEAFYGPGLLSQSQLDIGADGQYFNVATRQAYEWYERGRNASAELQVAVRTMLQPGISYEEYAPLFKKVSEMVALPPGERLH